MGSLSYIQIHRTKRRKKKRKCNFQPTSAIMKIQFVVLACALTVTTFVDGLVSISGTWKNQLGSTMTIFFEDDGYIHLKGTYCTKVARHNLTAPRYPIHGTIGRGAAPESIGFAVTFEGANGKSSTTAWSGQYREDEKGAVLYTTWVLTTPPNDPVNMWASTNVGQDVFRRSTDGFTCRHKPKDNSIV